MLFRLSGAARPVLGPGLFCLAMVIASLPGAERLSAEEASAEDAPFPSRTSDLQLHLFGTWAFGKTDGNLFATGSDQGNYENANLALNLSSQLTAAARIAGQIEIVSQPFEEEEVEVELDFLFLDWRPIEALTLRLGRVKHPFGISSEVFDVGTVRPFLSLAPAFYGSNGLAGESVDGLSATYERDLGAGWSFVGDVYVGRLGLEASEPWDLLLEDEEGEDGEDEDGDGEDGDEEDDDGGLGEIEEEEGFLEAKDRDDLIGARVEFHAPVDGLSFGLSAYTGRNRDEEGGVSTGRRPRNTSVAAQIQWQTERIWLRAEAFRLDESDEVEADGAYVELASFFGPHWQVAARWDWTDSEVLEVDLEAGLESLAEHRGWSLGLNYWFSSELVIKVAVHQVEGNRFSVPEALAEDLEVRGLDDETRLFELGVQLGF